jgi:hypothetical protein
MAFDRGSGVSAGTTPSEIAEVSRISEEVEIVAGIKDEVVTVANNDANITIVANDLSGPNTIGTVAGDIVNVQNVGTNIGAVVAVDSNSGNINAIATDLTGPDNIGTVASGITNINTVANDITNISTVANDITNVNTVAGDITDVSTVAGISADVTVVAGIAADVTAVAADATNIGIVAADIADVSTVAASITDVTTVATNIADVGTVALNIADISTVAGIDADVTTVAGISTDVTSVAGISADVTAVAGITADVTTVAGIDTDITTVAGIATDVSAVALDSTNIGLVATDITNVNTVAGSITNVNTVATDIADVNTVATDIANVNTVASNITNINTVAGIDADITTVAGIDTAVSAVAAIDTDVTTVAGISTEVATVAGISTEVVTVAGDATNIGIVATDIANVNTTATSITNINTVAADISNVNIVATDITDVNTVAGISTDVTTVASISGNVTTVAGNDANITTVAGISGNVTTVAGVSTNVSTVAGISGNVTTVAGISGNVTTVANNNTNINTVAGVATDIPTVAGVATDIPTVAGISTEVTTVAGIDTEIVALYAQLPVIAEKINKPATLPVVDNDVVLFSGTDGLNVKSGGQLGTAAFTASSDYATAAQGGNADTAYGWGDHATEGYLKTAVTSATAGTGMSVSASTGAVTFTNTAPDQTVVLTASTGISTSGTYPNFTITNSAPDQTVAISAGTGVSVTGTYPNFTVAATNNGTVTSVGLSAPTGFTVSNSPVTGSGTLSLSFASGYVLPTTASQSNWDTAYGWGDHSTAGYLDSGDIGVTVQGYDADTVKYDDVNPSFTDSGALKLPAGTNAERPNTPAAGQLRFNEDSDTFEGYNGTAWGAIGGDGVKTDVANTFTAIQTFDQPIIVTDIVYPVASFSWNSATASPAADFLATPGRLINAHRNMRRCVINDSGVVQYYLDPLDSTKKADGTSSVLTGADGMVMVEVPKFYVRRVTTGTITTWFVSDYPLSGYVVHPAFVKDGVEVNNRYYSAYDACVFDVSTSTYISGLNRDNAVSNTPNVDVTASTGDKLASVSGVYPMVGLTRAQFRTIAANRGFGWRQLDWTLFSAVQVLYLTEYQTFNSQAVLGDGNTNGTYVTQSDNQNQSPHSPAGLTNSIGNASTNGSQASAGASPGTAFMSYRGIENFFGNCWNWADGINVNVTANGNVHVTNNRADFADNTSTNMTLVSTTVPTTSGLVSAIAAIDYYFIASSVTGGSSSTYITDQWFGSTSSNRVVRVGGSASNGTNAGAFNVSAFNDSSGAIRMVGARLAF